MLDPNTGPLWASILQNLTNSRSSIVHAAEFAVERSGQADELLAAVVARTQSCPPQLQVTSLYLIDAIFTRCAAASDHDTKRGELFRVTVKWLPTLLQHISGTAGLAGQLCEIRKLVCSWEKKLLFEPVLLERTREVFREMEVAVATNAGVTGDGTAKVLGHERSSSFVGYDRTAQGGIGQLRHSTAQRAKGRTASPLHSNLSPPDPLSDARSDASLPSPPKTGAVLALAPHADICPHATAAAAATTARSSTRDAAGKTNGLSSADDGARSRPRLTGCGEAPSSVDAACAFLKACEVRRPPPIRRRNAE